MNVHERRNCNGNPTGDDACFGPRATCALKSVVRVQLCGYDISKKETGLMRVDQNGQNYLRVFLDAFRQNGKSEGTIEQYQLHLSRMLSYVGKMWKI